MSERGRLLQDHDLPFTSFPLTQPDAFKDVPAHLLDVSPRPDADLYFFRTKLTVNAVTRRFGVFPHQFMKRPIRQF